MEEKEAKVISKKEIEKVINVICKAEKEASNDKDDNIDFEKFKQLINSLEGCNSPTVVAVIVATLTMIPAGCIMAIIDMAKKAFAAKAMAELASQFKKEVEKAEGVKKDKE